MFFVDPEGERRENLIATPARRDAWLARAGVSASCTLLIGCGERGCPDRLAIDGGRPTALPVRIAPLYWARPEAREAWLSGLAPAGEAPPWIETLVAVQLSAGAHALNFSSRFLGGEHAVSATCRAGEIAYLTVSATDNERFVGRALVDWQVERDEQMPAHFVRRPLVILHDGSWRVGTEQAE